MGDHLDRRAIVFSGALLATHFLVEQTGRSTAVTRQTVAGEPFVMPQVQIGLASVVEDVNLTMLEQAQDSGRMFGIESTFAYGRAVRGFRSIPIDAQVNPFRSRLTTPPVTKICFDILIQDPFQSVSAVWLLVLTDCDSCLTKRPAFQKGDRTGRPPDRQ